MAKLIYSSNTSLDSYVADADGSFDWSAPDEQVHAFLNDLVRPVGTHLLGRGMYEVLVAWETIDGAGHPQPIQDFAEIWRRWDKIVYTRTLREPSSTRTRIEHSFDPEAVRALKASATSDLAIGGATLAAQAIKAGLVDELHQFISPVIVGGGLPFLPHDVRLNLELIDERRFDNGVVFVQYRVVN